MIGAPGVLLVLSTLCLLSPLVQADQLTLIWNKNTDDLCGPIVYRYEEAQGEATMTEIARLDADIETYADTHLDPQKSYCYRVANFNGGGISALSNLACGKPDTPDPVVDPLPPTPGKMTALCVSHVLLSP